MGVGSAIVPVTEPSARLRHARIARASSTRIPSISTTATWRGGPGVAGALDAWAVPATFKKARPGIVFAALAPRERAAAVETLIFAATTTFGIRRHAVARSVLDRRFETAATPWGEVRVKVGARGGRDLVRTPEYEDCARAADAAGVAPRQVYEAALAALRPACP